MGVGQVVHGRLGVPVEGLCNSAGPWDAVLYTLVLLDEVGVVLEVLGASYFLAHLQGQALLGYPAYG